jgi:hypothetical protein
MFVCCAEELICCFIINQVIAPMSAGYFMFIPARIAEHRRQIIQLLNVTCGREDVSVSSDLSNRDDGYLLMVRCGGGLDQTNECPLWDGPSIQVEPTAETAIGLSHIQVRYNIYKPLLSQTLHQCCVEFFMVIYSNTSSVKD